MHCQRLTAPASGLVVTLQFAWLLQVLAASPLYDHLATTVVTPNTTLGQLVDSKQRALLLFYDQWTSPSGFKVGSKVRRGQLTGDADYNLL